MRLIQYKKRSGERCVAFTDGESNVFHELEGVSRIYDLAWTAIDRGETLEHLVGTFARGTVVDIETVLAEQRLLPPIDHPEPSRFWITGTGLTHVGSADARDKMHEISRDSDETAMTDSMKIFKMGLSGGKPAVGEVGTQPEWFFKGVGTCVVPPETDLPLPDFALSGGEEAEIVGLYVIGPDGNPWRLGFTLGNEFSDQITEALNYLYLAHSKLRACSIGPELLLGSLPNDVRGHVRVLRDGVSLWQGEFASGEDNMCHSLNNLERHHFRYEMFRRPGDLHAYFFGAPILSCAGGVTTQPGDCFEIDVPAFGLPLRNTVRASARAEFQIRTL